MTTFDPRYGEAVPVSEAVVRLTANNPGPFTGAGTNTYLLGDHEVMIVDPGPDDPAHVDAIVRAVSGRPVTHIVITHTHRDHVANLSAVQRQFEAPTVAEGRHRPARALNPGEINPFAYAADMAFVPDIALGDRDCVANRDVSVSAIATPGHTANHLAFGVGDVCLSGDHVMGWSTTVIAPPDGHMGTYLKSLDRLLEDTHATYLPGHGAAIDEPEKTVTAMRSHRLMREGAILDVVSQGMGEIYEIVDRLYAGINPALRGAAAMSVYAHLEKLAEDGRVTRASFERDTHWSPVG